MRLWCVECCRRSGPEAKGWRMYRTDDEDQAQRAGTVFATYCPACAVMAFDEARAERKEAE